MVGWSLVGRLKSKATKREASLVIPFCGLDQNYSTPKGQGLNLEGYPEEELTVDSCTPTQVYPLVIRLQVVPVRKPLCSFLYTTPLLL